MGLSTRKRKQVREAVQPNLRDVQKAFTRQRIRDAARDLFYTQGYHATLIDEIVAAAGASRPTFYLHFSDKEEILREVIADYLPRAVAQMESFPGPLPSMARIRAWMTEWQIFIEREKASIVLITEIGANAPLVPGYLREAFDSFIVALARRLPAFAAARGKGAIGLEARVRTELLIPELFWAGRVAVEHKGTPYAATALAVVGGMLHDFIHDPRFAGRRNGDAES
jgi:AcrR family transcriptional regulator